MPELFCRRGDAFVERRVPSIPITCPADALGVLSQVRHHPDRAEVVALVLEDRRTVAVVAVDHADDPEAVGDVVEFLAEALSATDRPGELVIATIRPSPGPLPGDVERWVAATCIAEDAGCELIEWFVITGEVAWCPRDIYGAPSRW
jgi:hypothetical protein